ncbi:methyl-accepting chemotaxis protein [Tropicibacter oceani]|uniref:Methyl-accepting chemotaxis protein n=1 Tax=Tropicibacter oceani TaxID=3058420 RepID=A0ABY8QDA4_9RHOB|nr:methyl-accepting chemotaxis protein [Tropicibacter oceani]WGW02600.1 methyl-accepting chemotaxis protein [Tropicibacter oceani]
MSLKYRIIMAIVVCALVSVVLVAAPLYMGTQKLIEEGGKRELQQMEARIRAGLESRIETALSMAQTIAAIPRVQRAVANADTKGLHRLFVKDFATMSASTGVAQFQFHTPQAVSILRVHNPEKYGDDLSEFRQMVVQTNDTSQPLSGLERGRAGLGIRGVSPVTDDGEHLGSVEIGLAFDSALLHAILGTTETRLEVYILPDQSIATFEESDDEIQRITGNFDGDALLTRADLNRFLQNTQGTTKNTIDGAPFAGTVFTINDFSGQPVAIAHVLVPQSALVSISSQMTQVALGAAALAMALSAVMAWLFGGRLTRSLGQIIARMKSLAEGDTAVDLDAFQDNGEIGQMAVRLDVFRQGLIEAEKLRVAQETQQAEQEQIVSHLARALRGLADGDLDSRIDADFGEGYAQLVTDFNAAATGLSDIISSIAGVAGTVTDRAKDLTEAADDLSNRTETSAATLEQTAAALEQVTSNVRTTSEGAQNANESGKAAIDKARSGADIVSDTVQAMTDIDDSAEEIARITGLIDDIAFQTNLLALNAGVEAARAGEAGSGFAVVASEVQALARRTADAAGQIDTLITVSGEKVKHGVQLVNRTGSALDEIVAAVEGVTNQISTIADLAAEQLQSLSEVNVAVNDLDQTTQRNAAMFQQSTMANQALLEQGEKLQSLVNRFTHESRPDHLDEQSAA